MDPIGPWYTSYNRLAAGASAANTLPTTSATINSDLIPHHLPTTAAQVPPSTTASQLLLQPAHSTATLAGQPSPFNPGGFLSPPPVGYDVFSPLFHHPNSKQAHYVAQHRQTLVQAQTVPVSKPNSTSESDIPTLRESYNTTHQTTFFEHQSTTSSPTSASLTWTPQNSAQLPSPFGILPHESVVPSSPGPSTTKTSSSAYENNFSAHFASTQAISNINSPLTTPIVSSAEFKSTAYSDTKKAVNPRPQSPIVSVKSVVPASQTGTGQAFFQQVPATFNSEELTNTYSSGNGTQTANGKVQPPMHHQQSCIVSTPGDGTVKEYRIPHTPSRPVTSSTGFPNTSVRSVSSQIQEKQSSRTGFASPPNKSVAASQQNLQTKAQTKIYPELNTHTDHRRADPTAQENNQSSPISFSIMDTRSLNYPTNANNTNCAGTTGKLPNNQRTPSNNNLQSHAQQAQQQFHVMNQQQQQATAYRHYLTGTSTDPEYHHPGRSKSAASTDSTYSSNNSSQSGPDCSVVVPRRPSPLQAHSQASPLGHVPSPAYPMYNSPMASMSSPSPLQQHTESNGSQCGSGPTYKASVQQQVTPASPLDVTVPRPASQGQVAYSSVITRALGATENKTSYNTDTKSYDNQQQDFTQASKQQVCWENDARQTNGNRKFSVAVYSAGNPEISAQNMSAQQQTQRVLHVSERQQAYFDSNQVTLQDLSSCRGDPVSIVKNLQTLQQGACQVQQQATTSANPTEQEKQIEDRRKTDTANKKRKSLDKGSAHGVATNDLSASTTMTDYLSRVPPPAHHNTNQQQQNGYFDFERWNLPPPPAKMFPSASAAFSSQSTLHHTSNIVGAPAHQHQALMVPHHHGPPPIPYFPAFHIPAGHHPHHTHEFQSSVEINPVGYSENVTNSNSNYSQEVRDDQPKVIVPNIEEELGFLQQNPQPVENANSLNKDFRRSNKDPNSGFMTSYLKFLQGERDPSPPPAIRGGRKATWNRSKPYIPVEANKPGEASANGEGTKNQSEKTVTPKEASPVIDYANDPRYFPLPKERKKINFDSSDDGFTSDDDFMFSSKKTEKKSTSTTASNVTDSVSGKTETKPKKGRPIKPGGPTDRKRRAAAAAAAASGPSSTSHISSGKSSKKVEEVDPLLLPPRRETSRRKAKERTSVKQFLDRQQGIDYFDNDEEQGDSDSDPAWTPAVKLVGDEDEKRKKRGRPVITKKSRKVIDEDGYSSGEIVTTKKPGRKKHDATSKSSNPSGKACNKAEDKFLVSVSDEDIDISPFKSGEFVVIKADLSEEYPPLWRIDGKTLLQKYEPFKSNGKILYRNISTYSGWAPQNRHIYQQVPVKFWQQGKTETVIEFLRDEMIIDNNEYIERSMKETEKYQDNFEVYIQTLISQALDSNFLTEIFQEQDDYFLSNVKTVDEVTEERKKRLLSTTKWEANVISALSTWPCLNVLKDLPIAEYKGRSCAGCQQTKIHARILLYGQPYNATTLEGSPPNPDVNQEKDFLLCRLCQAKVALYNKVAHQKYLMFLECARRVADKRVADPNKDTTIILNELLADEAWLNQLFKEVRRIWAEVDNLEEQSKSGSYTSKSTLPSLSSSSSFSPSVSIPPSSMNNSEESSGNVTTIQTSDADVNSADSQVPTQTAENNSRTVSCDVQMNSIPS